MIFRKFRVDIVGDLDYEDLIADIYYENQFVAMLTQENGFENLEIEIHPPQNQKSWVFSFAEFDEAIQYAKNRLWELRKRPEENNDEDQSVRNILLNSEDKFIYFCRVCGLRQFEPPWGIDNNCPSHDICPCCKVEFGYEDSNLDAIKEYRIRWLESGGDWWLPKEKPANWSLKEQMKNIPLEYLRSVEH